MNVLQLQHVPDNRLYYNGGIKRLILFAGPSGSGKTTFLNNPESFMPRTGLPELITDLFELAPHHRTIMDLKNEKRASFENLCLHVDLSHPIRQLNGNIFTIAELKHNLTAMMYQDWPELIRYIRSASEVQVVTFFVRREQHFLRWASRALEKYPKGYYEIPLATVNGDSSGHSELHRRVYLAWEEFIFSQRVSSKFTISGNDSQYEFIEESKYHQELQSGYT
jgi:hypothetical protein